MPATSQLDWLISMTAMIVLFWSRATRDLLKSFGWGIAGTPSISCSDEVAIPRHPPHSVSRSPAKRTTLFDKGGRLGGRVGPLLSGAERARLTLARAFTHPSNLLVLDEPTNDLDLETLDLLQEQLAEYPGTVLLVSHDRDFLDRVVTSTIATDGNGRWVEYAGGYTDMLAQRAEESRGSPPPRRETPNDPDRRRKPANCRAALPAE